MSDELEAGRTRGDHLQGFAAWLGQAGYAAFTIRSKVRFASQFLRSLEAAGVRVQDLDEDRIDAPVAQKRRSAIDRHKALLQFIDHLRERGIAPRQFERSDESPVARLERRYLRHLREERGLADVTSFNYLSFVRPFLIERFGRGATQLENLTHRDVADFLLRHVRTMAPKRAQVMGTALRSFLRFSFLEAETAVDLSLAVPTVRQFRKATVPRFVSVEDVERILSGCDLATPVGRRDHAVLLLLARLGLRASEVVKLELGDVLWRVGELVVRGKAKVHDRLPLPKDVGDALTLYLTRDRAVCSSRRVFLRMRAPQRGFASAAAVTTIVARAVDRGGLQPPHRGAHLLRHSLATGMIQRGATMAEIGQLLRHRSPNSTELYAKVDFERLRGVSLPWPVGGAR